MTYFQQTLTIKLQRQILKMLDSGSTYERKKLIRQSRPKSRHKEKQPGIQEVSLAELGIWVHGGARGA